MTRIGVASSVPDIFYSYFKYLDYDNLSGAGAEMPSKAEIAEVAGFARRARGRPPRARLRPTRVANRKVLDRIPLSSRSEEM